MKKYIIIKADINDGDYISRKTEIDEETLNIIMPVINAIKEYNEDKSIKKQKFNWYCLKNKDSESPEELYVKSGKVTEEALDYFWERLPSLDNESIHTIESIELLEVIKETDLLKP
jgi:hypothetical protein